MTLDDLLREMMARRASDIHLQVGSPPMGRIDGRLTPFGSDPLLPPDTLALARALLTADQWEDFVAELPARLDEIEGQDSPCLGAGGTNLTVTGAGSADRRTWKLRSKSGSSTQTALARPNGTWRIRCR